MLVWNSYRFSYDESSDVGITYLGIHLCNYAMVIRTCKIIGWMSEIGLVGSGYIGWR